MGVAKDPLHVSDRQPRITCHPVRSRMTKIMKCPAGAQRRVRPGEHRLCAVVGQPAERAQQRPPQRLIPPGRHQALHLRLIQPQPDERVRRCRQLLHEPRPLADHGDQLLPRICVTRRGAQQLRGPGPGRHPEGDKGPVPVGRQRGEQLIKLLVRDAPRHPLHHRGTVPAAALITVRLRRVVVGIRPAAPPAPRQRERVHHRPRPSLQVQVVEGTQHALGVRPGRGRISHRRRRLPGDRVDRLLPSAPNPGPARPRRARSRLGRQLNPPAEIPGLRPGGLVPPNPRRPQETEPAKQVHPVRPLRGGRPPARLKLPQIHRDRTDNYPVRIDEAVRLERITGRLKQPAARHHQPGQIASAILFSAHDQRP